MCGWKDRCRDGNLRTYCHVSPILFGWLFVEASPTCFCIFVKCFYIQSCGLSSKNNVYLIVYVVKKMIVFVKTKHKYDNNSNELHYLPKVDISL